MRAARTLDDDLHVVRGSCVARRRTPGPSGRAEEGATCEYEKGTRTSSSHKHFWQCKRRGGLGIDDPFNGSQLHIVLGFTDALMDDFALRLLDGAYDHDTSQSVFIPDCPCSHRC